ncbi:aspartate/glutamate racemase family protein [Sodalis endosymbiont of Spalangia cameroni]|uniref:aspartate/glutamate racemase family protein n=1 Tax=Sodalis praecaptivus TaxID=1239307 RepID=UPI0031F918C2
MKTLGLLGGMSWESTVPYYRLINQGVSEHLGGLHSASLVLASVDFADIARMQSAGAWQEAGEVLSERAQALRQAGAQGIVLCTNTMHKVADIITQRCPLPLLHIADATAVRLHRAGVRRVGLLGTRFTMEEAFYRDRLSAPHGLEVVVPGPDERQRVHDIIFTELCLGILRDDSRRVLSQIIAGLQFEGVEGIVLGCTEIGLLLSQDQVSVPLFDTTAIHAAAAVDFALG